MNIEWSFVFQVLGIMGTLIGGLFTCGKFLISHWISGQEKIRELEATSLKGEIQSLKDQMSVTKSTGTVVWKELRNNQTSLQKSREQMIKFESKIDRVMDSEKNLVLDLDEMRKLSIKRIENLENTLGDAQFVKLGENHFMIKQRKKTSD